MRCRPFTLLDMMALIATTAMGWAWYWTPGGPLFYDDRVVRFDSIWDLVLTIMDAALAMTPCMAAWTMALPILRLRRPRRPLKDLPSQPGFLACLAATPLILWDILLTSLYPSSQVPGHSLIFIFLNGPVVMVAWTALAAAGFWEPERGWIDRAGMILGIYWIAMFFMLIFYVTCVLD